MKLLSVILALALLAGVLAGCNTEPTAKELSQAYVDGHNEMPLEQIYDYYRKGYETEATYVWDNGWKHLEDRPELYQAVYQGCKKYHTSTEEEQRAFDQYPKVTFIYYHILYDGSWNMDYQYYLYIREQNKLVFCCMESEYENRDRISFADIYDEVDDDIKVYKALLNTYNTNLDITYEYAMKAKNGL